MKRILFLGLVLLLTLPVNGQDFQAIQDNGYRLFDWGYGLRAIDVESTELIGEDLIFYLSKSVQHTDYEAYCLNPNGPSWMGDHVRISPDGTHLFFNLQGDTIRFELQAESGDTWALFEADGLYIQGEVVSVQEETILEGIQDIVKTVSLQAMNNSMEPVTHYVNGLSVKFSEHYGIVQPLNFVAFPEGEESYYYLGLSEYILAGIEGLEAGVQNLTIKEVFDFQPGDELHVKTRVASMFGDGNEVRTIYRFLDRVDQGDSIIYTRQVQSDSYSLSSGVFTYTGFSSETGEYIIRPQAQFDLPSMTPFFSSWNDPDTSYQYYTQTGDTQRIKGIDGGRSIYNNMENDCYYEMIDGGCYTAHNGAYIEERGGPYYHCEYGISFMTTATRELVYYNINSEVWGTPFNLLLSADDVDQNDFNIYPNPSSDWLYIESVGNIVEANIQISDLQGRIIKSIHTRQNRTEIDINELPAGVFIYSILSDERILKTGKFVVQR